MERSDDTFSFACVEISFGRRHRLTHVAMATANVSSSGIDSQGDVRRRNVPNGTYVPVIPKQVDDKLDEKTKQKVRKQSTT